MIALTLGSCSFDWFVLFSYCYLMNAVNTRFRQCHQGFGTESEKPGNSCQTAEGMGASLRALVWKKVEAPECYGGSTIKVGAILR